ncbi:unnamed protein product [Phytophthora fragariaefolia]|uniref:Unnamed protein product n=1 Tax=Phytophthora fragariaefolia TaxID=1490495 RepID=A0A9W6XSC0_9STRA|nr:unnamed protein product [Phytophthora fragariaefolia]
MASGSESLGSAGVSSTRESDWEAIPPSLSEGEEGGSEQGIEDKNDVCLSLESRVQELIEADCCNKKCLAGKENELGDLLSSVKAMTNTDSNSHCNPARGGGI